MSYKTKMIRCLVSVSMVFCCLVTATAAANTFIEVEIKGVSGSPLDNLWSNLEIISIQGESSLPPVSIWRLHKKTPDQIKKLLQPYGFYKVKVKSEIKRSEDRWDIRYDVTLGPQIEITKLNLELSGEGKQDPFFKKLLMEFPLQARQGFRHDTYENAKQELQKLAAERGYFDAEFTTHEALVDRSAYEVVVNIHFDTGPRYQFGKVSFSDVGFEEKYLQKFVPFSEKDPYTIRQLLELQSALSDTDYFQRVEVQPNRDAADALKVPIQVLLVLKKRTQYKLGLGYGTDTGARGTLGLERRYVNRKGHRFGAETTVSEIKSTVTSQYTIPVGDPRSDQMVTSVQWEEEDLEEQFSETVDFGLDWETTRGKWRVARSVHYQDTRYQFKDQAKESTTLLPLQLAWTYLEGDDPIFVRKGYRLDLRLRGATDQLISEKDTDFLQGRATFKWIHSFQDGRFIVRGQVGAMTADRKDRLPPNELFQAGGDQSVRGYDYKTLGPRDPNTGTVLGGLNLLVGSIEYEHTLFERWGAAIFYDQGNAYDDYSQKDLKSSAGFGIRWRSPVGAIRLDYVDYVSDRDESLARWHITIGPDL